MPTEANPQRCTKRDIAHLFGVKLADVDKWVRLGCPHESSGKVRAPLFFNVPQVWRWYYTYRLIQEGGADAEKIAQRDIRIWDLELALEVGANQAARILGYSVNG